MRFDPADGSKPTQATVKTGTLADPPQQNPQREGFRFDGWTYDNQPFDLQTPILQDTTLKAQWSKTTDWTLNPDHGPVSGARLTISPPNLQEPQFASIHASGDQFLGLTGDGRIYTWMQDSTPKQVPAPAQAPDGFRYLQAAAGSRRQAALGSDQRIYTWNSRQATPTMLDTGRNTRFTSISLTGERLLAVDRQGQVHAFQDSQSTSPKPDKQETISLPGKAQAVTAVASASRILALDAAGQTWTWGTSKTGSVKPERIKQQTETRIVQAQALNQGFLLLDAKGQARYLVDGTTSPIASGLPDGVQASRITANKDQAVITDTDGHVWAWKPGKTPIRADDGNQAYVQAAAAGGRITAVSRQGSMLAWSLDGQGQPGKPARLDTSTDPTLASASMDGQALTLSRKDGSWQTEMPAHKPGQAVILIAGRQDGKPFTRNLDYTVDQPLTRDDQQDSTYTVHFNASGGGPTPQDQSIQPVYGRVQRPTPDPTREGFQFDGWFTGQVAYDFSRPVTTDLTLTAHWTPENASNMWRISPDKGSQLGNQTTSITPPDSASRGIRFSQVSSGGYVIADLTGYSLAVGSDGNAYAWGNNKFGQLGNGTTAQRNTPVPVPKPAGAPADFTYVQADAGGYHSLAIGSDGYVYAWGLNDHGQLGNNTKSNSSTPVRVHGPGNTGEGLKAIQVAAGAWNSMALAADGTVYTWGSISRGWSYDCSSAQTVPITVKDPSDASGVLHAVQISTSWSFDMALGQDGYVYTWGYNAYGQLGNNTSDGISTNIFHPTPSRVFATGKSTAAAGPWLKAVQVSAGGWHALAIDEDGNTWAWGYNGHGELGNGKTYANPVPVRVQYPKDAGTVAATQISAGFYHSLALDKEGNAWAWGRNDYGQLGDNTTSDRHSPVKVLASAQSTSSAEPWLNPVQISAGWQHSLAVGTDGVAKAWGDNQYGQLGNPNAGSRSLTPVPVSFNLMPVITGVRFDQTPVSGLTRGDGGSVTVTTPAHQPGTVTVSVDYTLGGAGSTLTDTSLKYTYLPAGVLPRAGGEGILLALATGMTGMGGVLASRRHRRETHQLLHASHE
ncbi:InlB B-repeat-containing protein [Bifidobacterium sp. W8113]|uniref:RCC1 domain-containing protein n=1 Tax=Bifidobacterium choladohabitans TaxID=2750947 RepID=UPI0018DC2A09|nr:InlB B-repeat-containing protein [Bifidobacterium choladohabitans]